MANGGPRTRFPRPWSAGVGGGPAASSRRTSFTSSSTRFGLRRDWPQASVEQLIGDHYASCMDEARIDQLGLAPLRPLLDEIGRLETPADVEREVRAAARSRHPRALRGRLLPRQPRADAGDRDRLRERPRLARPRLLREAGAALPRGAGEVSCPRGPDVDPGRASARLRPGRGRGRLRVREEARGGLARQRGAPRPRLYRPQDDVRRAPEADPAPRLGRLLRGHRSSTGRPQRAAAQVPAGGRSSAHGHFGLRVEDVPRVAPSPLGGERPAHPLRHRKLPLQRANTWAGPRR